MSADIKTWLARLGPYNTYTDRCTMYTGSSAREAARDAEIADLRAALAAATAPQPRQPVGAGDGNTFVVRGAPYDKSGRQVPQPVAGSSYLRATVRDLDSIGMRLGADLVAMPGAVFDGVDYLPRGAVMDRILAWRREWNANSKARPDPRARQPVAGDERAAFEAKAVELHLFGCSLDRAVVQTVDTYSHAGLDACWKFWQARAAQSARQIATLHAVIGELTAERDGWKWVPKEPTSEMLRAAHDVEHCGNSEPHFTNAYKGMLAAAPAAPTGSGE